MHHAGKLIADLDRFSQYAEKLAGREKGDAQIFLDRLFQAFGHGGVAECGAVLEQRIRPKGEPVRFADLVWPGHVLIEMKTRGTALGKHYHQAFDYWVTLTPHRPRWVLLCNFDSIWVYDFDHEVSEPVDRISIADISKRSAALAFLEPSRPTPVFGANRKAVTESAANEVASVFVSLIERKIARTEAQRFVLQCVVAKFAEDLRLLPSAFFTRLLVECLASSNPGGLSYDLIGTLFRQMNTPEPARGGRFAEVGYFNGGIFAHVDPIELTRPELEALHRSALHDWSSVNPAIFGTLLQQSMEPSLRHKRGVHYTSETDILKVVMPSIVRPWQARLASATSLEQLLELRRELLRFRVLDPACGSGNFLYVAYRELKRVETDLILAIRAKASAKRMYKISSEHLSTQQFFGFDLLDFAAELAKVTLLLAKELGIAEQRKALEESGLDFERALPLDNLDGNIKARDALFETWPAVDVVIGNPPFQSKNKMQAEFGRAYLNKLRKLYESIPGRADYCVYFFRKAHASLSKGGRAGLVGTNTITQTFSRQGGLDFIVDNGGTITEAVASQKWSGDAVVHVAIVNWINGASPGLKLLSRESEDGVWSIARMETINSSLSDGLDIRTAHKLASCRDEIMCAQGQTHGHEGFLLDPAQARAAVVTNGRNRDVLFPYMIADDLLQPGGPSPSRYVIDFGERDKFAAMEYPDLFERIQRLVLPARQEAAREEAERNAEARAMDPKAKVNAHHGNFLKRWWLLSYSRPTLMGRLSTLRRAIVCGRVTKRPVFEFIDCRIHPGDALTVFPLADDYSFGILQSRVHWLWFTARCSTFKGDPRYTLETVFDTFPWPQDPKEKDVERVARMGVAVRQVRTRIMQSGHLGLREIYRAAEEPGENPLTIAQRELDDAVCRAYGMRAGEDTLGFLLKLNARVSGRERQGDFVTGPGLPASLAGLSHFVSDDRVEAPTL